MYLDHVPQGNNEVPVVKHSAYYVENDFSSVLANKAGLTILSRDI